MITRAFTLYAATVNGTFLDQVESQSYSAGLSEIMVAANGSIYPGFQAIGQQEAKMEFSTSKVATALSAGMDGFSCSGANKAVFAFQQLDNMGSRKTGNNHLKMTLVNGLVIPKRLKAGNAEKAIIDYEVQPVYDGSSDPFIIANAQSLTGSPSADQVFLAGPVSINGATLTGITSMELDFGSKLQTIQTDGQVFPSFVYLDSVTPTLTVETTDLYALDTLGLSGVGISSAVVVYLRKVAANGARVADGAAEHIKLTVAAGRAIVSDMKASGRGPASATVKISPRYDATNDIIAINTASAIT